MTWTNTNDIGPTHPVVKLIELSVRTQRLALIHKLQKLQSMIAIHGPTIRKHAVDTKKMQAIQKQTAQLTQLLKTQIHNAKGENHAK